MGNPSYQGGFSLSFIMVAGNLDNNQLQPPAGKAILFSALKMAQIGPARHFNPLGSVI